MEESPLLKGLRLVWEVELLGVESTERREENMDPFRSWVAVVVSLFEENMEVLAGGAVSCLAPKRGIG